MTGSITTTIEHGDGELTLRVEYDYDVQDRRPEITRVGLDAAPLGWPIGNEWWRNWDYSDDIDEDAVLVACAEHAEALLMREADRRRAQWEAEVDRQRDDRMTEKTR